MPAHPPDPGLPAGQFIYAFLRAYATYHSEQGNPAIARPVGETLDSLPEQWVTEMSLDEAQRLLERNIIVQQQPQPVTERT